MQGQILSDFIGICTISSTFPPYMNYLAVVFRYLNKLSKYPKILQLSQKWERWCIFKFINLNHLWSLYENTDRLTSTKKLKSASLMKFLTHCYFFVDRFYPKKSMTEIRPPMGGLIEVSSSLIKRYLGLPSLSKLPELLSLANRAFTMQAGYINERNPPKAIFIDRLWLWIGVSTLTNSQS